MLFWNYLVPVYVSGLLILAAWILNRVVLVRPGRPLTDAEAERISDAATRMLVLGVAGFGWWLDHGHGDWHDAVGISLTSCFLGLLSFCGIVVLFARTKGPGANGWPISKLGLIPFGAGGIAVMGGLPLTTVALFSLATPPLLIIGIPLIAMFFQGFKRPPPDEEPDEAPTEPAVANEFLVFLLLPRLLGIADNLKRFVDDQPFTANWPDMTDRPEDRRAFIAANCFGFTFVRGQYEERLVDGLLAGVDLNEVSLCLAQATKALMEDDSKRLGPIADLLLVALEPARAVLANPPDWARERVEGSY